jgi:hypothetical protein
LLQVGFTKRSAQFKTRWAKNLDMLGMGYGRPRTPRRPDGLASMPIAILPSNGHFTLDERIVASRDYRTFSPVFKLSTLNGVFSAEGFKVRRVSFWCGGKCRAELDVSDFLPRNRFWHLRGMRLDPQMPVIRGLHPVSWCVIPG